METLRSPFIDTILCTKVTLHPSQLNNNIYVNLKSNLIETHKNRCYKNYGFIKEIYKIEERSEGTIYPEDRSASVHYDVKFSCNICNPIEKTQIICTVNKVTSKFISATREPISILITRDRINENVFSIDPRTGKIRTKEGIYVKEGDYIKITVESKQFADKDTKIIVIGRLDNLASDKEVEDFYSEMYKKTEHVDEKEFK